MYTHVGNEMSRSEKWSWIGIVFSTSISLRDTVGRPIEWTEESEWENELFLSIKNRLFGFMSTHFKTPKWNLLCFANYIFVLTQSAILPKISSGILSCSLWWTILYNFSTDVDINSIQIQQSPYLKKETSLKTRIILWGIKGYIFWSTYRRIAVIFRSRGGSLCKNTLENKTTNLLEKCPVKLNNIWTITTIHDDIQFF